MTREEYQKEYLESFIREEYDPIVWGENLFTDNVREVFREGIQCADTMPKPELVDLSQVWHDAQKEPKSLKQVVAIDKKGRSFSGKYWPREDKEYNVRYSGIYWNGDGCLTGARLLDWEDVVKWAYIEDLLPKGGE